MRVGQASGSQHGQTRGCWGRRPLRLSLILGWTWSLATLTAAQGADPAPPSTALGADQARRAVASVAPGLPGEVVAHLQAGRFDEAIRGLDGLIADGKTSAGDRSFLRLVRGGAARLANRPDDARATWQAALDAEPKGVWVGKIRGELASLELATGHPDRAEALARTEAEALLAPDRKDRLALVYRDYAERLLHPEFPGARPDPAGAAALLGRARDLAKGSSLRASLLFARARAGQQAIAQPPSQAPNPGPGTDNTARPSGPALDPIGDYNAYLKEYPQGADRAAARFHLGETQLALGQSVAARLTWTDLARDLLKDGAGVAGPDQARLRGQALYGIAQTFGVPRVASPSDLALGVAALERFLRESPDAADAPRASFEIGLTWLARGQADPAIAAFRTFLKGDNYRAPTTDEARRDLATRRMQATFLIARATLGQGKYVEAVAAFEAYLVQFPNGPQSADARRAILNARFAEAREAQARERFADARALFNKFAEDYPLDNRVPIALFNVGATWEQEKRWDDAIAAWDLLASRFPGREEAAHAQFAAANLVETEKGDPAAAIERFRKIQGNNPWVAQANQRIATMEGRALTVITPRTFRSGETAHLKVSTRNLANLTFSAYKLNPEEYFRKKQGLNGVAALDIGLVSPDAEWTVPVPGFAQYKPVETTYDLRITVPGVYVVKVSDEKHLQASALVVGSEIDAIVKASRDQLLVFAQDMRTGQGRPGARVLVADGERVVFEGTTGADGVVQGAWKREEDGGKPGQAPGGAMRKSEVVPSMQPPAPDAALQYLVIDGASAAGSGLGVPDAVARGLTPRAYLDTDRPAYRPGQEVAIRGIVREASEGQYRNPAGATYRLEVVDSQGRTVVARPVTLGPFGTFQDKIALAEGAPVGAYAIRLTQPGGSAFSGGFEVQNYQLARVSLDWDLPRTVFYRGEVVRATLKARYGFDAPASGRPIAVQLPDGRTLRGQTDGAGQFAVEFGTDTFGEDEALALLATLPGDNVAARAAVRLASLGFGIDLSTARTVYLDGETITLDATTRDALGQPTGQTLRVAVVKPVAQGRQRSIVEREVTSQTFTTDKATGKGQTTLRIDEPAQADYILRVAGTDQFGHTVVADTRVTVSGQKDDDRLRLLADRTSFRVGEEARVRLVNRGPAGPALVAWEADRILRYRVIAVPAGESNLDWPVDDAQFPNFTLAVARMAEQRLDQARLDVRVERDLRLTVTPKAWSFAPGAQVEVEIRAADQMGRPVAAEVGLALVDQALLRRFGERLPPIGPFFYDQTRVGGFNTESTITFSDHPTTQPVSDAVVDEAERQSALVRNQAVRTGVTAESGRLFSLNAQAPMAPAPGPAGAPEAEIVDAIRLGAQGIPIGTTFGDPKTDDESLALGAGMGGMGGRMGRIERDVLREEMPALNRFGDNGTDDTKRKDAQKAAQVDDFDAAEMFDQPSDQAAWQSVYARRGKSAPAAAAKASQNRPEFAVRRALGKSEVGAAAPRQGVVETAYWNPAVVTGADGRATLKFAAPAALSEYRLMARGVTGADSLVGQTTATITVRQDFFVDLKTPARLTEGDKPRFIAEVHHVGVKPGTLAQVRLVAYAEGGAEQVDPKTVELRGDGVTEVAFEPITVPDVGSIRLTVTARAGDRGDETTVEIPVHPWGVEVVASAAGTSSNNATATVGLPPGRNYDDVALRIELAPSLDRLVIDLALERSFGMLGPIASPLTLGKKDLAAAPITPCPIYRTVADEASDLLALVAALRFLGEARASDPAEATRLRDRARGIVGGFVAAQTKDGGWPWVTTDLPGRTIASHRLTSTRVAWALREAADLGIEVDGRTLNRAGDYLATEWNRATGDPVGRAATLHALALLKRATFEQANTLNRVRGNLDDFALSYLALAFGALDRPSLAGEALDTLAGRAKTEAVGPGSKPRVFWEGKGGDALLRGPAEATSLATLAFARLRPSATEVEGGVAWLLAHRTWSGWSSSQAKGPAVAALALSRGRAAQADDRYRLAITVNETEVAQLDVVGSTAAQIIGVPRAALRNGGAANTVRFAIQGRGTFGYAATLTGFARDFGPEQKRDGRNVFVASRDYLAVARELDGRALPIGFTGVINPTPFVNKVTEVGRGGRARVDLTIDQDRPSLSDGQSEFLLVEETLPAGATLVEGSVSTTASSYTVGDGTITFAFPPQVGSRTILYDLAGFVPGEYRVLPTRLRDAHDPNRVHLGPVGNLRVLPPESAGTDPYRASPDELFARGKQLAESGRLAEAAVALEELFSGYTPRDEVARDAARILLTAHIQRFDARRIVRDFEVLKEKGPEVVIPFDEVLVVGRAYREIQEPERAFLVFRALAEASYLEDAQVGEVLRQNGQPLEAMAYLLDLWRESPGSASIAADLFGLSQTLTSTAGRGLTDATLRDALARAEISRVALLGQSIRLIQSLLALDPRSPLADEASLALLGNELELEDFEAVTRLAPRFANLYPRSKFLDSFQYADALGRFQLGQYDAATETARRIAAATYPDSDGVAQPSPNKWQALYILGQIHDARRQPGAAIEFYRQVADRFSDAADAVTALSRRTLALPEVTILRPPTPEIGGAVALNPATARPADKLTLSYRNITDIDLKVYPVDLMRLYLTRRNLDGIAGIDLAGITPLHESTLKLADGLNYTDATRDLDLPIVKEGAYLIMVRGGDLYASGIVLVSPLELEVTEEASVGRVRVVVRDAANRSFVPKVQVKVIGSNNPAFTDGRTDLRGVVVAEQIRGQVTAVARREGGQYAFYRGTQSIGPPPAANAPAAPAEGRAPAKPMPPSQTLFDNLRSVNESNAQLGIDRLQNRLREGRKGILPQEAR